MGDFAKKPYSDQQIISKKTLRVIIGSSVNKTIGVIIGSSVNKTLRVFDGTFINIPISVINASPINTLNIIDGSIVVLTSKL